MERGISENAYYYRLRKIREAASEQIADAQKKSKALIPSGWAELVEIETGSAQESCLTVEIGGCQIIVNNETDTALLKKVCGVLKTL
jgi:gamma-glutamyl phosphate reductase